jgi:hypothetical protein
LVGAPFGKPLGVFAFGSANAKATSLSLAEFRASVLP